MQKEKKTTREIVSEFSYVEGKLDKFYKSDNEASSYRVYEDGIAGIFLKNGTIEEKEGFARAKKNLVRKREYPFELETGVRHRDKTEQKLTDEELKVIAEDCMNYLKTTYPRFTFGASFNHRECIDTCTNDLGMDYSNKDRSVNINVWYKHVDSKDLSDGGFGFSLRTYDPAVFRRMADDYLANYEKELPLPEEFIIDTQYYGWAGMIIGQLNAENLALGNSLLAGKIGQKVFSEDFTLLHDVSDEECWFNTFWDGEGVVTPGDKRVLIDHGVILTGYSDKRCAKKYGVPYTGNAYGSFDDLPGAGGINGRIVRSKKTVKELLNGRMAIVLQKSDGGFNDKGELTISVYSALLTDGEKILGKLPPFTLKNNLFDMFGKDYIGVGSDQPIFHDKQILVRMNKVEM